MPDHQIFNERPESQERALRVIEQLGYTFVPRGEAERKRGSRRAVLFEDELQAFLGKQQYAVGNELRHFSGGSVSKAITALDQNSAAGLYASNKEIYDLLCSGKSLEESIPGGSLQSFDINYIDFEHPENNILQVTDEFEVERPNGKFARPDIVVLINGIPLVVIECKRSSVDVMEGVSQNIRNWGEDYIPQLFRYTQLVLAMNPDKVLYGTCGTSSRQFVSWHEDDKEWLNDWCRKCSPDGQIKEQDRALVSLLHPERLLVLIRNFIIYDNNIKKICRYKQYFAVKKCMKTIQDYLAERDSEKYLSTMENIADDFRHNRNSVKYPENIVDDGDAKSFYGAVCTGLKKSNGESEPQASEEMGSLALAIKAIIVSQAKRDWRDNVIVHREIKKRLDDLLFDFMEEHNLDWSLDTIDIIIDEILMVAKRSY